MIKPREGEYKGSEIELAGHYMFIAASLTEEQVSKLKEEWNKQGGYEVISWWKFVMQNTKLELDIKEVKNEL